MTKKRFREKTLPAAIMVGPVTLWLILLVAVPLIYVLVMSFCSIDEFYNVTFQFTLDNYKHLADASYIKIYAQSLVIALLTTVICILVAYPFTYIIARTKSRLPAPLKKIFEDVRKNLTKRKEKHIIIPCSPTEKNE